MNIILLSGGSGKRLWPLSNEVRAKQFLKILRRTDGTQESMLQRMYYMLRDVDPNATITIATSESQVTSIRAQIMDENVNISVEPCRKDTFPAIALATAYLHDIMRISENEAVVVSPIDTYVEKPYFEMLQRMYEQVLSNEANIILMGIEPTYPSEKYGYIIPQTHEKLSFVDSFREKPNTSIAEQYIKQGALWNGGVFAYRINHVLSMTKEILGTSSYRELFDNYIHLPKVSFDYAVVEKESKMQVMRFSGKWTDLGTWNTFTEVMSTEISGNAIASECQNTHIINELQIPLIALGVKNLAIISTPDGILVTDKASSDRLKDYVTKQRPMHEERAWGEYKVLEYCKQSDNNNSLTKHLIIKAGQHISYQLHKHRVEIWTFVAGKGMLVLDGRTRIVERGDIVCIQIGVKHAIEAQTDLHIIEVQIGDELTEEDIERFDWPVKRDVSE